jgi:hypothetical protein
MDDDIENHKPCGFCRIFTPLEQLRWGVWELHGQDYHELLCPYCMKVLVSRIEETVLDWRREGF